MSNKVATRMTTLRGGDLIGLTYDSGDCAACLCLACGYLPVACTYNVLIVLTSFTCLTGNLLVLVLQLEYVSIAGFVFVLMLVFTMVVESCKAGLPAIGNGEFAVVGFTDICARLPHSI